MHTYFEMNMDRIVLKVPWIVSYGNSGIASKGWGWPTHVPLQGVPHSPSPVKLIKMLVLEHIHMAHLTQGKLDGAGSSLCSLPSLTRTHSAEKNKSKRDASQTTTTKGSETMFFSG